MKIKIIKANEHSVVWYNNLIGQIFTVREDYGDQYIVNCPPIESQGFEACVWKKDVEVIDVN